MSKPTDEKGVEETTEKKDERQPFFARRLQGLRVRTGLKGGSCTAEESGG